MTSNTSIELDIKIIAAQEKLLRFEHFDNTTAWALGNCLKDICECRQASVVIEIRLAREMVFFYAMPGTSPANADWARRKRNTVELLHQSSYAVGLKLITEGATLELKMGLPVRDFSTHGGSFPIYVNEVGCVGAVTISGQPQREDHSIIVSALAQMCRIEANAINLAE